MTTTYLVTGAAGNVGSQVARALDGRGARVRAFVRDEAKAARVLGDGVELVRGDYADADSVRRAVAGVDALFLVCPNHPCQLQYETGVIDAAVAAGVRRVVKLSTIGAERGSPLEFWDVQGRIEEHLREVFPGAVVLRSSFYMTNILGSAEQVRGSGKLFAPAGGARISMIDPRDVAAAGVAALLRGEYDGRTLTLTGSRAITYGDVADELSAVTGRPIEFVPVPDDAARQGMLDSGMPAWVVDRLIVLFGLLRQGAASEVSDTIREVTGREPRTFADFARDHAAVFRS